MRDRATNTDRVGVLEPNVLDGGDAGRDREPDINNPEIEAPEEMIEVHAGEQTPKKTPKKLERRSKSKTKKRAHKIVGPSARKRLAEPRERGGASIPCLVCGGPTRVLATRRSEGRWPGKEGEVWRRRLCKRRTCRTEFETIETPRVNIDNA